MTPKKAQTETPTVEEDIAIHIFTTSATLLGVSLTVIGIIHVIVSQNRVQTLADDALAIASSLFLCACTFSYAALRWRHKRRMRFLEKAADIAFMCGIVMLTGVSFAITYMFI